MLALLLYVLFFGTIDDGARRWIPLPVFNLQPSEFAKVGRGAGAREVLRREPRRRRLEPTWRSPAGSRSSRSLLIAKEPDLGTAVTLVPMLPGGRVPRRHAHADARHPGLVLRPRDAGRLEVRAQGLPEVPDLTFLDPSAGRARCRLPADPGAHHRRVGRADGQGVPQGHAGPAAVPAGRPQRFHLLGAGRGAGVRRRPRGARAVSVRDSPLARGRAAGQGSARRLPRRWACSPASRSRWSTTSPCRPGWRPSRGSPLPAHELRRFVDDRHARRVRADPQRQDAADSRTGSGQGRVHGRTRMRQDRTGRGAPASLAPPCPAVPAARAPWRGS